MIFVENKYHRWYRQIVERGRSREHGGGMERHHVEPRSMGGSNAKSNLVSLTYREHFLAHWLLTKITNGADRMKMLHALSNMRRNRILTSWQFEVAKSAHVAARRGVKRTPETIAKMSASLRNPSAETRAKIGAASKGRRLSQEAMEKIRLALIGRPVSETTRAKIGAANSNLSEARLAEMRARRPSEETRAKLSHAAKNRTEEHRKNIAEAQRGKIVAVATREKIAAANRKRLVTQETRDRMRASQIAQWACRKAAGGANA